MGLSGIVGGHCYDDWIDAVHGTICSYPGCAGVRAGGGGGIYSLASGYLRAVNGAIELGELINARGRASDCTIGGNLKRLWTDTLPLGHSKADQFVLGRLP